MLNTYPYKTFTTFVDVPTSASGHPIVAAPSSGAAWRIQVIAFAIQCTGAALVTFTEGTSGSATGAAVSPAWPFAAGSIYTPDVNPHGWITTVTSGLGLTCNSSGNPAHLQLTYAYVPVGV